MQDLFFLKMHGFMGFNHIKKNYSGKTGVVFKIAGKIPLLPSPRGLSNRAPFPDCGMQTVDYGLGIKHGLSITDCTGYEIYGLRYKARTACEKRPTDCGYKTREKVQNTDFLPSDHGA